MALVDSIVYRVKSKIWLYQGESPWHFITIPKADAEDIKKEEPWPRKGFGSIRVKASIGKTTWETSIFPTKKGTYDLPIKKEIRDKEKLQAGDSVSLFIKVVG